MVLCTVTFTTWMGIIYSKLQMMHFICLQQLMCNKCRTIDFKLHTIILKLVLTTINTDIDPLNTTTKPYN